MDARSGSRVRASAHTLQSNIRHRVMRADAAPHLESAAWLEGPSWRRAIGCGAHPGNGPSPRLQLRLVPELIVIEDCQCGNEWTLWDESLLLQRLRTLSLGPLGCNGRTYGRFRHRGETPQGCAQARKRGSLGPHGPAAQLEAHECDASGCARAGPDHRHGAQGSYDVDRHHGRPLGRCGPVEVSRRSARSHSPTGRGHLARGGAACVGAR